MLAPSGRTPAIHRIEIEWEGFGDAGVGGSAPWRLSLGKAPRRRLILSAISPGGGTGPVFKMVQNLTALRLNCDEQFRTMAKRLPYVRQEMP
jgi:hypothetical protein